MIHWLNQQDRTTEYMDVVQRQSIGLQNQKWGFESPRPCKTENPWAPGTNWANCQKATEPRLSLTSL